MEGLNNIIADSFTVKEALQRLNEVAGQVNASTALFVVNNNQQAIGSLSDGDIRRGLISGKTIDVSVKEFINPNFRFLTGDTCSNENIKKLKQNKLRFVPLLDQDHKIIKILDLSDLKGILPVDAIIMAGGEGRRLLPLTKDTPKPLLKVGSKPILEHNIDRLMKFGIDNFNITVRYLGNKIEEFLGNGSYKGIKIKYAYENKPLGTFGAIGLIDSLKHDYVFVMNSDLLTNIDFQDFFEFFLNSKADMAVASIPYHVDIPYAVFEMSDGKKVKSFREKPRYTYYSNAGIYIIKREFLSYIKPDEQFDATDMMNLIIERNKTLVSYPITGYWLDIGRMEDYHKAQEDINHITF